MPSKFGATTDHFSLAGTDLILISSTKAPLAKGRADALDEKGDIVEFTHFGLATIYEVSCTYCLKSGSLDLSTLDLGMLATGILASSIEAKTENGSYPTITVNGRTGAIDPATLDTFALPAITITGIKAAQLMGFTIAEGCKILSCGLSASIDVVDQANGLGVQVAMGISGGIATVSAEFQGITVAPGWTLTLSGLVATQAPGADEPQAAYMTGTGNAEIKLTRTVPA